nr:hypothetical protein CFP56_37331 [Quercus suber]
MRRDHLDQACIGGERSASGPAYTVRNRVDLSSFCCTLPVATLRHCTLDLCSWWTSALTSQHTTHQPQAMLWDPPCIPASMESRIFCDGLRLDPKPCNQLHAQEVAMSSTKSLQAWRERSRTTFDHRRPQRSRENRAIICSARLA